MTRVPRAEDQPMMYLAAMTVGSQLVLAADVPKFNAEPSCRAAAAVAVITGRTTENCMNDERDAHDQLQKSWTDYSAADTSHCLALVRSGGGPSYVELLSCVEMSRDARRIAHDRTTQHNGANGAAGARPPGSGTPGATTGSGPHGEPGTPPAKP